MKSLSEAIKGISAFLDKVFLALDNSGIALGEVSELDHLAYRVESFERYEQMKREFSDIGELVSEEEVIGRPIAVYRLKDPITYQNFTIPAIELPAPKPNNQHKEGLEHAEFVLSYPMADFLERHSNLQFDTHALDRKINPTIELEFDQLAIKFHERSLLTVAEIQKTTSEL